jgi:hypothetical protein
MLTDVLRFLQSGNGKRSATRIVFNRKEIQGTSIINVTILLKRVNDNTSTTFVEDLNQHYEANPRLYS